MNMMRKTLHPFITLRGCLFLFHFPFSIFYFPSFLLFFSCPLFLYFTFWPGICGEATVAACGSMFDLFISEFSFLPCVGGAICFSLSCLILCECLILPLEMKSLYYYYHYPSVDVVLHVTAQ